MGTLSFVTVLTTGVLTFYSIPFGEAATAAMQIAETLGKILCRQQTGFLKTLAIPAAATTKPPGGPCGWYVWSDCGGKQCKSFKYQSCDGNTDDTAAPGAGAGESNETGSTGTKSSGMDAPPNKYPSIVMIQNKDQQVCSGVVIDPNWVLTAAHCFTSDVATNYAVVAGVHDQKKEENGLQNATGNQIFKHDKYDENSQANDIALLKLSQPLEIDAKVKATKLPAAGSDLKGEAFAVGWAQAADPSVLQEVRVTIMDSSSCKSSGELNENEICISGPTPEACTGDPGGPIYSDGAIAGIASRVACNTDGKPGIFTKVSPHIDWIKSTMESSPGAAPRVRGQRIVQGKDVTPHKYTSIVLMKLKGTHACGGSIINENWVLTAAHCLDHSKDAKDYTWVAAEQNKDNHEGPEQVVKVVQLRVHAAYNAKLFENDIAMTKVSPPFKLNAKVKASKMPPKDYNPTGKLWVAGWGATSEGGSTAASLQEVDLPIVPPQKCKKLIKDNNFYAQKAICTGYTEGGKDACQGDSGGPLYHINGGQQILVGVVSWGQGCARKNTPGVFTKVSYYLGWIQSMMKAGGRSAGIGVVRRGQAFRHKYPSFVAIKYQGSYSCVGTILDKEWVITAGSCLHSRRPADYQVVAGDSDILKYEKTEQVLTAQQIILHESLPAGTDLMLLRMSTPFKFTQDIKPAYLPVRNFKRGNISAKLVRWGLDTLTMESMSGPLLGQEINMTTLDALACRKLKPDPQLGFNNTLCAVSTNVLEGCLGDIGSPLYYIDGTRHVLVGVRSAHSCDKSNGIEGFTDIPPYLNWISSFISPSGKRGRGPAILTLEGDTVSLKSYPAAVMLTLHKRPKCSGVLIGPAWALTSAYCLSGSEISALKVVAGREDSSRRNDPFEQVADIIETYEHPLYNAETGENDIGLVFFSPYFLLDDRVRPVRVPSALPSLSSLTTIGWGVNTAKPSQLKEISLKVAKCGSENITRSGTFCVTSTREGSQCRGDPGSPVFTNSGRTLVGIQSRGETCGLDGNNAGVVTRVVQYRDWITRTMARGLGLADNSITTQPPKYKNRTQSN